MTPTRTAQKLPLAALVCLVLFLLPAPAKGAATSATSAEIQALRTEFRQELDAVKAENKELKDRLNVFETAKANESRRLDDIELQIQQSEGLNAGYDKNFYIKSADDKFKLKIGGYLQVQGNIYESNPVPNVYDTTGTYPVRVPTFNEGLDGVNRDNSFFLRRMRLKFSGHIFTPKLTFVLEPDFAASSSILREGIVSYKWNDHIQLTMGQMKPPFSMENLISSSNTETIERAAIVNLLGLDYRIGAKLSGDFYGGKLGYAIMVANNLGFGSDGRNSSNTNDDFAYIARVSAQPWKDNDNKWIRDLQVFFAAATGINGPPSDSSGLTVSDMISTPGQNPRVRMTIPYIGGRQTQIDAAFSWMIDRWHLSGEYIWAKVDRRDVPDTMEFPYGALDWNAMRINGGYLMLSYVLLDKPGWTLIPVIKAEVMHIRDDQRLEMVVINPTTGEMGRTNVGDYNNDIRAFTAGVTWFINPHFKIMGNWVLENVGEDYIGPTRLGLGENRTQNIFMIRSQLKF